MAKRAPRADVRLLILALVAVAAAAFALAELGMKATEPSESEVATAEGDAVIGGPFSLIDQDGKTRTDADYRGSLMLVYFGYTNCPDVCPLALATMSAAVDQLGDKGKSVVPIFITVDPERDTAEKLKPYAAKLGPRLVALSGSVDAIAAAAKAYHVYFAKHPEGNGYSMDHSTAIYLMGPDGKFLTHFNTEASAQQIAEGIAKYL